jgi:hypothetical protein
LPARPRARSEAGARSLAARYPQLAAELDGAGCPYCSGALALRERSL